MTRVEALMVREQAIGLRDSLRADIPKALTRGEHIRITQLAAEAERLVAAMDAMLFKPETPFEPTHH
jgi:DUF438 domain-containing protein